MTANRHLLSKDKQLRFTGKMTERTMSRELHLNAGEMVFSLGIFLYKGIFLYNERRSLWARNKPFLQ